jgi:hypothetical protein
MTNDLTRVYYLGDNEKVKQAMETVAKQGKARN